MSAQSLQRTPAARRRLKSLPAFGIVGAAMLLLKLWMTSAIRVVPLYAPHDESNFLEHAKSLVLGQWLGPYDQFTLIKGPLFPMFMAAADFLGVPLTLAHQLLYFAACAVACVAIWPLIRSKCVSAAILAFLLFNPYTFSRSAWFADRSEMAETTALLTIVCAAGLFLRRNAEGRTILGWSCALGCALAGYWLTREDHIWLLPATIGLLVPLAVLAVRAQSCRRRLLSAALAVPFLILIAANLAVAEINAGAYGWRTVVEIEAPEYVAAYASLARISAGPRVRRVPVSNTALHEAYAGSEAARELRPAFEGDIGANWSYRSCQGALICNGFAGSAFLWTLRDAVAAAGHYHSGPEARAFYVRLSTEIGTACDVHRISCDPLRVTMMPPMTTSDIPLLIRAYAAGTASLFTLSAYGAYPSPEWANDSGPPQVYADYQSVVRAIDPVYSDAAARERAQEDGAKFACARALADAYRDAGGWLAVAVLAVIALRIVRPGRNRLGSIEDHIAVGLGATTGVASFICVLSLVDVSSFSAFRTEYFAVAYPTALFAIAVIAGVEVPKTYRSITGLRARVGSLPAFIVPAALCASFIAGSALHQLAFSSPPSSANAGHGVPATQPAGAVPPAHLFSPAQIDALKMLPGPALGSIDTLVLPPSGELAFATGWIADPATKGRALGALLILDGRERFNITPFYGVDRPDVARALSSAGAEATGIGQAPIWLSGIAKGKHVVQLGAITDERHYRLLSRSRSFTF